MNLSDSDKSMTTPLIPASFDTKKHRLSEYVQTGPVETTTYEKSDGSSLSEIYSDIPVINNNNDNPDDDDQMLIILQIFEGIFL